MVVKSLPPKCEGDVLMFSWDNKEGVSFVACSGQFDPASFFSFFPPKFSKETEEYTLERK